jgi:hypothetical protein
MRVWLVTGLAIAVWAGNVAATEAAPPLHCTYNAYVVDRHDADIEAICTAAYTRLTITTSRDVVARRSNGSTNRSEHLGCTPADRATRHLRCTGHVRARVEVRIRLSTTSLCSPLRVTYMVTAPFPNGPATLSLRSACGRADQSRPARPTGSPWTIWGLPRMSPQCERIMTAPLSPP